MYEVSMLLALATIAGVSATGSAEPAGPAIGVATVSVGPQSDPLLRIGLEPWVGEFEGLRSDDPDYILGLDTSVAQYLNDAFYLGGKGGVRWRQWLGGPQRAYGGILFGWDSPWRPGGAVGLSTLVGVDQGSTGVGPILAIGIDYGGGQNGWSRIQISYIYRPLSSQPHGFTFGPVIGWRGYMRPVPVQE